MQLETIHYTAEPYEQEEGTFLVTYKKWDGKCFTPIDLETLEEDTEHEEYWIHSLPNQPEVESMDEYLKEHYKGCVVNVHHYRYLTFDYNPETEESFLYEYEAGETYVNQVYITEDGEDLITV